MIRINIGCGQTPTKGWKNYDNSWSVRLARKPILTKFLIMLGQLKKEQKDFIAFAKGSEIVWADATKRIPEASDSVDVLYSSHMIEHLDKTKALLFHQEAFRVLKSGGIIRLVVPNIQYHVDNYLQNRDADQFISATLLTRETPKTIIEILKYLWIGDRHHRWMYDGSSLCNFLLLAGFQNPKVMIPGETMIIEPGDLNLFERASESVIVEAIKP